MLAVGPVAAATHADGAWDGAFGGELFVARVREHEPLSALAVAIGAYRLTRSATGRAWADVWVGTYRPLGVAWGVSGGPVVEFNEFRPPQVGWQASIWLFAGAVPYARVGSVGRSGRFAEVGLRIPLPAIRWR